jgi:predicted RNA-binding protein associated with RNAse of E/G family
VWADVPAQVIEDSDAAVVLYWPAGTVYEMAAFPDRLGALAMLARGGWPMASRTWWGGFALHVIPTGAPYSLWPYRDDEGRVVAWYCNLQAPLTRTDVGFESNDWTLDVVAAPDLSSWKWKDEDELEEAERVGLYDADLVAEIRRAGLEVIERVEARDPVFDRWRDWQP